MMKTFAHFDTLRSRREKQQISGCITANNLYVVSPGHSAISLTLENMTGSHDILLSPSEHPGNYIKQGHRAVTMTLSNELGRLVNSGKDMHLIQQYTSLDHLPSRLIAAPEMVTRTQQWIERCPYAALKNFVYQVLGDPTVGCAFFSVPASTSYHHREPGGLAQHSLEVAEISYAATQCFEDHERWLAAVSGLLHDVGKVRTLTQDCHQTAIGLLIAPEILNVEILADAFINLDQAWADGAIAIRYILGSLMKPRDQRPLLPLTTAVKQADIASAAASNRRLAFADKPSHPEATGFAGVYWKPSPT